MPGTGLSFVFAPTLARDKGIGWEIILLLLGCE